MKKFSIPFFVSFSILLLSSPSNAESIKLFTLKDGSRIKGQLISVQGDIYKIQTAQLGEININGEQIVTISAPPEVVNLGQTQNNTSEVQSNTTQEFKDQTMHLQQQFSTDPDIMKDIQNIIDDPEMMQFLSDKNFISDMMSYDTEKIKNNPRTEEMMRNPKIQGLINKIQGRLQASQTKWFSIDVEQTRNGVRSDSNWISLLLAQGPLKKKDMPGRLNRACLFLRSL